MDPVLLTTFGTLIVLLIFTVPIGVSIGKDTYKDTDHAMTPHFGAALITSSSAVWSSSG